MTDSNVRFLNPPDKLHRERLLEMLLAELDGMVYRCRVDEHWTMEFVSGGCDALTGYNSEELLFNSRITYEEITHPLDRSRVRQEIYDALNKKRPFNIEYRICHADGNIRWVWERGNGLTIGENGLQIIHGFVEDITQRRIHEQTLTEAESRYRSIFENATEGIFQTTEDGYYLEVNSALASIYGYESPQALMYALRNIDQQLYVDAGRRDEFIDLIRAQGYVTNFESRVYQLDGSIIWISENAHTVRDPYGKLLYYEGTVVDITTRKTFENRISYQATHDSLTDLPNRTLLTDRIQQAIHTASREKAQLAIIFIDLDNFKNVNDTLGHMAGDTMIREIAERLKSCLRESDTIARIGGDEFVLLLPDIEQNSEIVSHAIQRVLSTVQEPCVIQDREFSVGCSIGVSMYPGDGDDAETLLKHADMAMYKAKQTGRNTFHFFTEKLNRSVVESLELEHQLRQAINDEQFELHYQPQVNINSGKIVGAEALVRWQAPQQGMISPARFIPIAEKSGLIDALGAWVLHAVCKQIRYWLDNDISIVPISLNISPRQFNNPGLIDNILAALRRFDLPASLLKIEITESCMAHDQEFFLRTIEQLTSRGLKIAIDDFGSGYSNMRCLRTMEVDTIKVDRSFITSIENRKHRAIYTAIVSMAHNLNFRVIAEGVETQAQYEFLSTSGCDEIQGYYFSMPLTAENFAGVMGS